jgi:hypothetical protein
MGIDINTIKDPRQRARYEEALRSGGLGPNPDSVKPRSPSSSGNHDRDSISGHDLPGHILAKSGAGVKSPRLISQSHKPILNKLETAALAWLMSLYPFAAFHSQAWRVKIGNGAWFKVDLCAFLGAAQGIGRWYAWEVKELRGKNAARGILALKCAAHQFPEVRWCLLVRQKGVWREQEVLP